MLPKTPPPAWPLDAVRAFAGKVGGPDLAASETGLTAWLDKLVEWNARLDLTAAKSLGELVDLMLPDAIVLAAHLPPGAKVVDVGTGAGAPGLGLALLRPDLQVTLCEPLQKRAAFLRTVVGTVRCTNVSITSVRGEALPKEAAQVAISRATLNPPEWLALALTLVEPEGEAWVLLAQGDEPTAESTTLEETVSYKWPNGGHARRALRYRRTA